jgi:hypothetical protein
MTIGSQYEVRPVIFPRCLLGAPRSGQDEPPREIGRRLVDQELW